MSPRPFVFAALVAGGVLPAGLLVGGCTEEPAVGSLKLDLSACMRINEAGSCGQALVARYTDDVPLCIAVRTGAGDQALPAFASRSDGALRAAPGAPELELSGASEQATFRVFYLAPGTEISVCTPTAFTVATRCTADTSCVLATEAVRADINGEGATVTWGGGGADAAQCAFECGDPSFCGSVGAAAEEICDDADNDCDGATDEGFDGLPDGCDDLDNDCDGELDEDARSAVEICNGADDDCDGDTDEGVTPPQGDGRLGEPCSAGEGTCERLGIYVCDDSGTAVVCGAAIDTAETTDVCGNGLDEDCDGEIDEGDQRGLECFEGIGACRRQGVYECNEESGLYDTCSAQAAPAAAVDECGNRIDDNCDGIPDDNCDCVPRSSQRCDDGGPGAELVGKCKAGTQQCNANGRWTQCEGSVLPAPEICDGQDDDCDGSLDETFPVGDPCSTGLGVCLALGVLVCDPGDPAETVCNATPGAAIPGGEACNGRDDDCDGEVDEAPLSDAGAACGAGQGICAREGLSICIADPDSPGDFEVVCDAQAGEPDDAETCNGIDDTCDGETDEAPYAAGENIGSECSVGVGECRRRGALECDLGSLAEGRVPTCDAVAALPADAESCDGLDNLCVGAVDTGCDDDEDGFCDDDLALPNPRAVGLECTPGDCDDTAFDGANIHPGVDEADNDVDDDCDDLVDEGFATLTFERDWRVEIPGNQALSFDDGNFTIEAWVRADGFHRAGALPIFSRRATMLVDDGYMFGITGNTAAGGRARCEPFFMAGDGGNETWVVGNTNGAANDCEFPQNRWIHLAATFEHVGGGDNRVRVFQDGVQVAADDSFRVELPPSELGPIIGEDAIDSDYRFIGSIADVRVSGSLRYPSDDPIAACLDDDDEVIALWRISEGTGGVVRDSGPLGMHGNVLPADEIGQRWEASDGCAVDRGD